MQEPLPCYDDLDATLREAWGRLVRGVKDRRSGFHTLVLASLGEDGAPEARTLVLRKVDPVARSVRFHSDWRSRKIASLKRQPRVAVHGYCAASKMQLRLSGVALLHDPQTQVAQEAFARSQEKSQLCYAQAQAPGLELTAPSDVGQMDGGAENFSVIEIAVDRLEWLYLNAQGHRRALFTWQGEALTQNWLAP